MRIPDTAVSKLLELVTWVYDKYLNNTNKKEE